jgi:hypothetical protein
MKTKTIGLTLAFCFLAGAACFAADPQIGTWKLNEAKSKFAPGTGKNTMVVYKNAMGGKVKITTDGIDANGKAAHSEWTGKFDGKDYSVTGDPLRHRQRDQREGQKIQEHRGFRQTVTGPRRSPLPSSRKNSTLSPPASADLSTGSLTQSRSGSRCLCCDVRCRSCNDVIRQPLVFACAT